jgi:hypothetical protein
MSSIREPVESIVHFYSVGTLSFLEKEIEEGGSSFESIIYQPSESSLARIEDDNEYDREESIALWATMFACITFMCDNIENHRLTPEQSRILIENLTRRCTQLLRETNLNQADLRALYLTTQLQQAWAKINQPQIFEMFNGYAPFIDVFTSFQKLRARLQSLAQMDALSDQFRSMVYMGGPDDDRGQHTASVSSFGSNAQQFQKPRPSMSPQYACNVLDLKTELLGKDWLTLTKTVRARVLEIVSGNQHNPENCIRAKQAGQALINYSKERAGLGGGRRTMKTKKRFVKRGKKTRMRRNNKSKRVIKGGKR